VGACVLAFYLLHLGWFLIFGPPQWFEAVQARSPQISSVQLGSAHDRYLAELRRAAPARLAAPATRIPEGLSGSVVREDRLGASGPALLQTRSEGTDRIYVRAQQGAPWREIVLPQAGRIGEARWIGTAEGERLLVEGRRPWWPRSTQYGRFWIAIFRPALRPSSGLYLLDPRTDVARFLCAGAVPTPSPDRASVAFLRSSGRGLHSLHVWTASEPEARTVVSLWEADPGSGRSFHWRWSDDSAVLFVQGRARGYAASPSRTARAVDLLYELREDRLAELAGASLR
jgi:hypothetical protein